MRGRSVKEGDPTTAAEAGARNLRLPYPHRGASRLYGLEEVLLPPCVAVAKLAAAVDRGFAAGRRARGTSASCVWNAVEGPDKGKRIEGFGFGDYGNVNGKHVNTEQRKRNCVIEVANLRNVLLFCSVLPGLADVLNFCLSKMPNMVIALVHLIDQGSVQQQYDWHLDHRAGKGYEDVQFTFVFLLSTQPGLGGTSMRIGGKAEYHYPGPGHGVLFRSRMWHKSCLGGGARKLVVFMKNVKR